MSFVQHPTNTTKIQNEYDKDRKQAVKEENTKVPFYYLKKGKTILRILPAFSAEGVWFKEYYDHHLPLGGRAANFTCARQFGQTCLICNKGEELSAAGNSSFKDFQPKRAYLFNAIVLSDNNGVTAKDGVKVLKSGVMVKKEMVDLDRAYSEGYGDITNITSGFTLAVERTGDTVKDTRYNVKAFRDRTNIIDILKAQNVDPSNFTQFDLNDAVPAPRPIEEVQAAIEGKAKVFGFPSVAVPVPGGTAGGLYEQVKSTEVPATQLNTVSGITIVPVPVIPEPPTS